MARLPRFVVPGQPQHVIQRGNNRSSVFFIEQDYFCYLDSLGEACQQYACDVHAYVLMTNHIHLLVSPQTENGLSQVMQAVGGGYSKYINRVNRRTGTLWEGRYRASAVDTEGYLLTCYRYIELNPVRAGIVDTPEGYRWSSYGCNALGHSNRLITEHDVYRALGADPQERRAAYQTLFRDALGASRLAEIRNAANGGWALGHERFRREIERATRRRATPLPKGGARSRTNGV